MAEVKIKCSCGKRFTVTESDAIRREVDFDGQDDYVFECPNCDEIHYVWASEFRRAAKRGFWDFLND